MKKILALLLILICSSVFAGPVNHKSIHFLTRIPCAYLHVYRRHPRYKDYGLVIDSVLPISDLKEGDEVRVYAYDIGAHKPKPVTDEIFDVSTRNCKDSSVLCPGQTVYLYWDVKDGKFYIKKH